MIYVCTVCGYVYDEAEQTTRFDELASDWVCPWCGADKTMFEIRSQQSTDDPKQVDENDPMVLPKESDGLSFMALSALCSNLARGCEKQHDTENQNRFEQLATYFKSHARAKESSLDLLIQTIESDVMTNYRVLMETAQNANDRATQRVGVWGDKVSRILLSLLKRYRDNGSGFIRKTDIWVCSVCGFVYVGDNPPTICPVCKVPDWKFERIAERRAV